MCYAIITAFGLPPVFAIGLMLLAASPGGISANLFSHLFGGNVAMNISLTAVNTLLSIVTLPLIANWAIAHFAQSGQVVPMQTGKLMEVIAIVLIPVLLGMAVARKAPGFSQRMEKPVKVFSAVVLAVVTVLAIAKEWSSLATTFGQIGPAVLLFNLVSLFAGYYLSRAAGLDKTAASADQPRRRRAAASRKWPLPQAGSMTRMASSASVGLAGWAARRCSMTGSSALLISSCTRLSGV